MRSQPALRETSDTTSRMNDHPSSRLQLAKQVADVIASSTDYKHFVEIVRTKYPWRFEKLRPCVLERDYLRIVDHHLQHLLPQVQRYMDPDVCRVLDFGCGSGGSAIALAMVYPDIYCYGTDIDPDEISIACARAELYKVSDRCEFHHVSEGQPLPFSNDSFDFCQCSSVLEYAVDAGVRQFCIQEMVRLVGAEGLLFFSVPNRLYPYEIHTHRWGWNYFPKLLHARTVDCSFWEVRNLARPTTLRLHGTPIAQLFRPWSNFCVRKQALNQARSF
jgi:SAM-dependent methyltransferase